MRRDKKRKTKYQGYQIIFTWLIIFSIVSCNQTGSRKNEIYQTQQAANPQASTNNTHTGFKVIGIKDGDTFVLLIDGKEQTIRLAHIDCPEKNQSFGNKAKQFASGLCFGKYVTFINNKKYDRNKRLITELFLPDGSCINKLLVKNGLAWHFKKYSDSKEYAELEKLAKNKKAGLWSEPNPVAPWNWRKKRKDRKVLLPGM